LFLLFISHSLIFSFRYSPAFVSRSIFYVVHKVLYKLFLRKLRPPHITIPNFIEIHLLVSEMKHTDGWIYINSSLHINCMHFVQITHKITLTVLHSTHLDRLPHHLSLCPHFCDVKPRIHVYLPQLQYHIPPSPVHSPGGKFETDKIPSGMPESVDSSH